MFTSNSNPSTLEILVRTGKISQPVKPIHADKGLGEATFRDGVSSPFFLAPLLARPDLAPFEPISEEHPGVGIKSSITATQLGIDLKAWILGLNGLGNTRTLGVSQEFVGIRSYPKVSWAENKLRNLVLFRFRCGIIVVEMEC